MAKIRRRPLQRAIEEQLPKSGVEQIRAAHHLGDLHDGIVDDHGQLVGRHVVFPPDDKIAKLNPGDGPLLPGALIEKLKCFTLRNAEPPVLFGRILRCRNR